MRRATCIVAVVVLAASSAWGGVITFDPPAQQVVLDSGSTEVTFDVRIDCASTDPYTTFRVLMGSQDLQLTAFDSTPAAAFWASLICDPADLNCSAIDVPGPGVFNSDVLAEGFVAVGDVAHPRDPLSPPNLLGTLTVDASGLGAGLYQVTVDTDVANRRTGLAHSDLTPVIEGLSGGAWVQVVATANAQWSASTPATVEPKSSNPQGNAGTLPRLKKNIMRLTFDADIGAVGAIDLAGMVEIRELLDGCTFGDDLVQADAANFSFAIEADGGANPRVLRIEERADAGVLNHQGWYAVINRGAWAAAAPFERQLPVLIGDADGNRSVTIGDVNYILNRFGQGIPPLPDDTGADVNADGTATIGDVNAALNRFGNGVLARPAGH